MLKSVATKIAHNSTIPALAGNSDLRPLQDLITAEKSVLVSLQRLSVDFAKASEALRIWGSGEGDDLGDTLTASASVLAHFSSALTQYASLGHRMRDQLKAIRTREEALDDLKRRRKSVMSSAESAEKKLNKMNPEHKNLEQQQETLNRLRNEIRSLDSDILSEEASLGDFKRTQTKTMMGLKFGGLLECVEKGIIAGEYGKLIITEIPEETTPPGIPRSIYYGRARTEQLVAEAYQRVSEVVLSTTAPLIRDIRDSLVSQSELEPTPWAPSDGPSQINSSQVPALPQPGVSGYSFDSSPPPVQYSSSSRPEVGDGLKRRSIEEFGTSVWNTASVSGSRFNTYPPRLGTVSDADIGHMHNDETYLLHSRHGGTNSFTASVNNALASAGDTRTDDLAAPPSYAAQMELPPDPEPSARLESGYQQTDAQASGRHSAYSEEHSQIAYMAAASGINDSQHSRSGDETPIAHGQYPSHGDDEFRHGTQSQQPPSVGTGSGRANAIVYSPSQSTYANARRSEEEERAMDAAVAREVGREMEGLNLGRHRGDSLPQSVQLMVTDENGSGVTVDDSTTIERMPSPLLPPAPPFAKRSISPRAPFEQSPASSSSPVLGHNSYPTMNQGRQTFYSAYDQSSPKLPSLSTNFDNSSSSPPSPRINPKPALTPLSILTRVSSEQQPGSAGSLPPLIKAASSSSLPSGTRTISAAAFKRSIPKREESDASLGDGRSYSSQSVAIPGGANTGSRPLPTTPQDSGNSTSWNNGAAGTQDRYTSGRFVTNLENEWR